ncbi:MAG: sulfurtransferase TusA family protein [Aigarchaeota archaeon]|uniref:Sulfurtransferase TusA family protein n=1 Tax=Caldiarchaeum subterraneum TaxID=311458 RepID=A0A7C4E1S2_CALS0|nr:sulfurtransferase TusA family protein [Candidatus Caldarchaeales archaeon]MDJ0272197.1 sulfurtransferase TusA family protein [Candidatus Caldarchaeales archaeon]
MAKPVLTVDVRGAMCPWPVLKTREAVQRINVGEVVEVLATDPASKPDLEAWARKTGNRILSVEETGTDPVVYRFLIERVK